MNALVVIITFIIMEFVAWFTHKFIMHGFLWVLHQDHHQPTSGIFEKNDFFFLIFAIPSMILIILGSSISEYQVAVYIGLGILFYGIAYFFVHEILIHQRIKWFRNTNVRYFKGLRRAHKIHHKHLGKEDGECFGMLVVPIKYFRQK